MADSDRSRLERQQSADPEDEEALLRLLAERARVEGEDVYLACLLDRLLWNQSHAAVQDLAVLEVSRRLGAAFRHVETKIYECAAIGHRIASFEHQGSGALMNLLPAGRFMMGSPESEGQGGAHEGPVHEVCIRQPFLMGRFAVSQAVWDRIGSDDNHHFNGAGLPIQEVSWDDCQSWLAKAGDGLRLPSESEWEYATRAGSTTAFCFGENISTDQVNCDGGAPFKDGPSGVYREQAVPVGSLPPNAFGLFEVHGNVDEWCQDGWVDGYQDGPDNEAPREPAAARRRVYRGGSWFTAAFFTRSAYRYNRTTGRRLEGLGFRVARGIDL